MTVSLQWCTRVKRKDTVTYISCQYFAIKTQVSIQGSEIYSQQDVMKHISKHAFQKYLDTVCAELISFLRF